MRRVAEGESFTITVNGRAVADLVPHQPDRPLRPRLLPARVIDELLAAEGPGPDPEVRARDMTESDRLFGDDGPVDPWEPRQR